MIRASHGVLAQLARGPVPEVKGSDPRAITPTISRNCKTLFDNLGRHKYIWIVRWFENIWTWLLFFICCDHVRISELVAVLHIWIYMLQPQCSFVSVVGSLILNVRTNPVWHACLSPPNWSSTWTAFLHSSANDQEFEWPGFWNSMEDDGMYMINS
jgi:hypothetical protein